MATAAVRDALLGEELPEIDAIVSVEASMIDLGERLRPVDQVWARALGELMLREGQRTPIDICRSADGSRWEIAGGGGHRLTGAQLVGIEYLKAIVHSADADERRRREIAENLHRRDLDPIERAAFVAEAVAIQKRRAGVKAERSGRSVAAEVRWQKALKSEAVDANVMMTVAYGWTQEVADALGFSLSTVERDLLLYRRLAPSLVERLRAVRHPILSNASQLRALAKLEPAEQDKVVALLCRPADPHGLAQPAKSVSEALARLKGANRAPSDPAAKNLSAFIGAFSRMPLTEKKGALHELRGQLPAGFKLLDPSQSNEATDPAAAGSIDTLRAHAKGALEVAFDLLIRLGGDGDPVEDEEIWDARKKVQRALLGLNSGEPFHLGEGA